MYTSHFAQILWLLIVLTTILAVWKGGIAERIGAVLNLVISLLDIPAHMLLDKESVASAMLVADFALALGFLLLAVRYASIWLGGAMLLAAVQFSLHAYYIVDELPHDLTYAWINNLDTLGVVLLILFSTIMSWIRSVREARAVASEALGTP
jgi:hypothetical protein